MIWNSIILMTVIDLIIIGLSLQSIFLFKKYNDLLRELGLKNAVLMILIGLICVSLFYLTDLLTMFVLPSFTSMSYSMQVMEDLHLNWRWLVTLFGMSFIVVGLSRLISKLLPRTYKNLKRLETVELELRDLNKSLETKVDLRTLELKRINEKLVKSQERYKNLVEKAPAMIYAYSNLQGGIYYSPQVQNFLGYSPQYLYQHPRLWQDSIHPDDLNQVNQVVENFVEGQDFEIEYRIQDSKGNWHWFYDVSIGRQLTGNEIVIEGIAVDISKRKLVEAQLEHIALHDPLTQLPNRSFLMPRINQALVQFQHDKTCQFALLLIDIDQFQIINNSFGHEFGDLLLVEITQRLQKITKNFGNFGLVTHLGSDEFVILWENIKNDEQILELAETILRDIQIPININNIDLFITASIGIALSCDHYEQGIEILRDADNAMYKAKRKARNSYCIFDYTMHEQALKTLHLQNDLKKAIKNEEFQLYYQPIINLFTFQLVGVEVLIRWIHPQKGIISPFEFIGLAEETRLIIDLGRWILFQACSQMKIWKEKYKQASSLKMHVNTSSIELEQSGFIHMLEQIIQQTQFNPIDLKLEITESVLLENNKLMMEIFEKLGQKQIEVCLDDFGVGYSSLSYIHNFPFKTLKIDKSFVQCDLNDMRKIQMIETIINVAYNLGMDVVAEGIETETQLNRLQQLNCEMGQGYFCARPLNTEEFERYWLNIEY